MRGIKKISTHKGLFSLLPADIRQQFNSHHPYSWNDGSMIQAKGFQTQVSFGLYAQAGPISLQLKPEVVYAQNAAFSIFPSGGSDSIWKTYYTLVFNMIDNPERFGNRPFLKVFPGQSNIRLNFKKFSLGLSTENLWWGPGIRNALVMSNNAPGFPHLTLNTNAPLRTPIGAFEGQLISGLLQRSGFLPPDTGRRFNGQPLYIQKAQEDRYINGIALTWQPKWTTGLYLGLARAYYMYRSDVEPSLKGYLPVISQVFKGDGNASATEDASKKDQLFSFFFRLVLPKEKAEVYAELGRNDHSGNLRDLLLEPEHSRAYVVGFRKLFETKKKLRNLELMAEFTNLQIPMTILLREQSSWYSHYQVRDGYTQQGQVIGAGIGSGASSQTVGLSLVEGINKLGLQLERVVRNNDFYYAAFASTLR